MDSPTANLITILRDRVNQYRAAGDYDEALHAAKAAVDKSQQSLTTDLDSVDAFVSSLEIRAELLYELGRYDESSDDYRQALDLLDSRPDRIEQLGRLYAGYGAVHDALGNDVMAAELWEKAIQWFERHEPPLLLDIAAIQNNLGFVKKAMGDLDAAENYYLKALEILHAQRGTEHEAAAAVSSNLGALYHAAGYHEQAREMHMIALEARRSVLGEMHPDTAQSHNNLALALLETGDRAWARHHFERAFEAYAALGHEYAADFEAVGTNYAVFLRDGGEHQLADDIENRVRAALAGV